LIPQQRTCGDCIGMSALCQQATFAGIDMKEAANCGGLTRPKYAHRNRIRTLE